MNNKLLLVVGILAFVVLFGCLGPSKEPTNVAAKQVTGGITVSWDAVADVAGYNIYRSTATGTLGSRVNPVTIAGETSYKDTEVQDGTTYYYTVKSVDKGGTEAGKMQASATAKVRPPQSLQIVINSGQEYATSAQVSLSLYAVGAKECRLSNDGAAWSDWAPYAAQMSWALVSGDGQKEVYYQCRDSLGNTASPVSEGIRLDTTPPSITVTSPVEGQQYESSFDMIFVATDTGFNTLTCSAVVDGTSLQVGVVSTGVTTKINVPVTGGSHVLKLTCSDGPFQVGRNVSFTSVDKPGVTVILGDGSGYTDSRTVKVELDATNAKQCRLSNDGTAWYDWFTYTKYTTNVVTQGDGTKYIYAQCRNANGVVSDTEMDSIILDTSPPPYISVSINNGDSWTNSRNVRLGFYAFAAEQCRYSNEDGIWSGWQPYVRSMQWTLTSGYGSKKVYYDCQESTGKDVGTATANIQYSSTPPNPPTGVSISINGGAQYTMSRNVQLSLNAKNAYACRFQENGQGWTDWEGYATARQFTLTSSGDGTKAIYYQCKNDYGTSGAQAAIYLDENPPHPITDLRAEVSSNSVYLKWTPVGDAGSGVASYNVYRSNRVLGVMDKIGNTASSSYTDYQVVGGNTYTYIVRAVDFAGREGDSSNAVNADVKGAGNVRVTITAPLDGAQVYPPVVLTYQADDDAYGTVNCNYYLNGNSYPSGNVPTGAPHSEPLNLDPSVLKYTVSVICTDEGGGSGNSGNNVFYPVPSNGPIGPNLPYVGPNPIIG